MALTERLNGTLQENLITILAYDDSYGKIVANLASSQLFEGEYRVIAERSIDFWRQHGEAPKVHTPDLMADILEDAHNRKAPTIKRMLRQMAQLSEGVNTKYVLTQLFTFQRVQQMKTAILDAAEKLNRGNELAVSEVEEMLHKMLQARQVNFDAGMRLTDFDRAIEFLQTHWGEFRTGIEPLDNRNVCPARGALFMFLAPPGAGKTWFLINCGKEALKQRKRVVHISLEMGEEEVMLRYYQALFSASKRKELETVTILEREAGEFFGKVVGLDTEEVMPQFGFDSPAIRDELEAHTQQRSAWQHNLIVKRFPPRTLTTAGLNAYLDNLEIVEGFIPDAIIMDSPYLMDTDEKNQRISIGRRVEEFRAVCIQRNAAGMAGHQVGRGGAQAQTVDSTDIAEDWSVVMTADAIATFSQTPAEKRLGLARIYVPKARSDKDKFSAVITQNYGIGQFCLDAAYMKPGYFKMIDASDPEGGDSAAEAAADEEEADALVAPRKRRKARPRLEEAEEEE